MTDDKNRQATEPEVPIKENAAGDPQPDPGGLREVIQIDLQEYDPESPQFNPEKWEEYEAEAMQEVKEAMAILQGFVSNLTTKVKSIQDFFTSGAGQAIREAVTSITKAAPAFIEIAREFGELIPFIEKELEKPQYEGKTVHELLQAAELDENGEPTEKSLFSQALAAARKARDADKEKQEARRATITKTDKIDYPLDKINSHVWNLLEEDTAGQIQFDLSKRGSKQEVPVYYAINFDDLDKDITITKRLLPFDKRVYIAVAALFNAGNNVITLRQIYNHMGYTGRAGGNDLEKINRSIVKMLSAQIYINNEAEAAAYKNYSKIVYRGSLLPLETGEVYNVQGALTDAAIHIFREPPLVSFARQRKQITTVDIKLLQSPASKTDANLQIDDYLLERISRAKHGKGHNCRILFKTLYARAGVGTKKQKQRAPKKICGYLDYYKQCGFIDRYTQQQDGVTVFWK